MSDLSGLNPTPHAIAVYASSPLSPVATQHSLPSGRYSLLGPDFHRLDRTSLRLAHVAVATRLSSRAPRTEPYGRLSRIPPPPRVHDGNCLPYTLQRLGHASLALSPVRALLVRIPLGPRPSLRRLCCACVCRGL